MEGKTLICIIGPTAVGKSALSLRLAQRWKTGIISADARQVYRGMDIGTAKVTPDELALAPHHLVDILTPDQSYDAATFATDAEKVLADIFSMRDVAVMAGGSTLYLQSFWYGFDPMPEVPAGVREGLNEELTQKGLAALVAELEHVDPATFSIIDRQNPARVIRALEVYRASGQPISSFRKGRQPLEKPYRTLIIGLEDTREVLYQRIDRRVEEMLAAGLENEVLGLLEQGYSAEAPGMRSIGYQEWFPFINGVYDRAEVLRLIQRNSRRYAKRQFTFFRRFPEIRWFTAGDEEQIINWLETEMASSHS